MIRFTMKRTIFGFVLFIAGVLCIVFLGRYIYAVRNPKEGMLRVNSEPAASIFLNNVHKGRTPFEGKVPAGEYTIKLVSDSPVVDVSPWQGKINVSPNLLTYVNRDLSVLEISSAGEVLWLEKISSSQSELLVTTVPDGATIILNDETKGVTPMTIAAVDPGDYSLTVSSPGFLSRTVKVKLTGGYKLNASVQLALSPQNTIETDTPEATSGSDLNPEPSPSPSPDGQEKDKEASPSSDMPDPEKPYVVISSTPTGFLRVRSEPSVLSDEISRVEPGDKFTILDTEKDWYKISYDGKNEGWISGQYADVVD